ncbi:hypothetical protein [Methanobrevibacter sp. V74]|uniref:hypothetical protein n=1 Tax=Methanobrevibacter sp. V74 TaxID=3064279 RepID=UPI002733E0E2|nr:hypothetical protein [Methanobrevibacter sp. V74]
MNEEISVNLSEWSELIIELSSKEIKYYHLKEKYNELSEEIIASTDFKQLYGKNNESVRKNHVKNELLDMANELKELEFSIDYCKRRLNYLKGLVTVKTALLEAKNEQ